MNSFLTSTGIVLAMLLTLTFTPSSPGHRSLRVGLEEEFCSHDINIALLHVLEERMIEHTREYSVFL